MRGLTVELIPDRDLGGFTAQVPGIPAYGEGATEALAIADLEQALTAYIEEFGIDDAMARVSAPPKLVEMNFEAGRLSLA